MKQPAAGADGHLVKVFFTVAATDWRGGEIESLWASKVEGYGRDDLFMLENSPFYFRGASYLDIVEAERAADGGLEFRRVFKLGGHSTYQILAPRDSKRFAEYWTELQALGCSYESGAEEDRTLYSVDVPPTTDLHQTYSILKRGEADGVWVFQEAHVGHPI